MIEPYKISGRLGNQMFQIAYLYALTKKGVIPDIYVQDPSHFEFCKDDIKRMFGDNIIKEDDYVGIHVRRGDYVNNPFYVDLMKTDYYKKAMAEFPDNTTFIVVSDDVKWCSEQPIFKDNNCKYSLYQDELKDLNLMAGCKGLIIANSSYSWWAGYLNKGKVVAPKAWYTDKVERTKCPDHWTRI